MIKLDNFVLQMVKGEGDEMKPGAVIRFNSGEGDKKKQFEHMLSDEESQHSLGVISFHLNMLMTEGAAKNQEDFREHIRSLDEDIELLAASEES